MTRSLLLTGMLMAVAGCSTPTQLSDLMATHNLTGWQLDERTLRIDLNGDGRPERLIVFNETQRGIETPATLDQLREGGTVLGFALFDGQAPDVPVYFQWFGNEGLTLTLRTVENLEVLVAERESPRVRLFFGAWSRPDSANPSRWQARVQRYDSVTHTFGAEQDHPYVSINTGK